MSCVSIHAPTRGATLHLYKSKGWYLSFNPRTHEGCDRTLNVPLSVHICFNPRTHEGCDLDSLQALLTAFLFQSTHPRGVRPQNRLVKYLKSKVSIHAPTRGATVHVDKHALGSKFQSTHPRGVRHNSNNLSWLNNSFNPRTHEGCDSYRILAQDSTIVSIHAPTRGATAYSAKYRILIYKSSHFANINQTITFKVIKSLEFL